MQYDVIAFGHSLHYLLSNSQPYTIDLNIFSYFGAKDVSRQLKSGVFQLQMPIRPTKHFFIVGDPKVARAILTDPLTTKPARLYSNLNQISGGPTILTL